MQVTVSKKAAKGMPVEADVLVSLWKAYWNDDLRGTVVDTGYTDSAYLRALSLQDSQKVL